MARINLLPWRAERRKLRQKDFLGMLGLAVAAGIRQLYRRAAMDQPEPGSAAGPEPLAPEEQACFIALARKARQPQAVRRMAAPPKPLVRPRVVDGIVPSAAGGE